MGRATDMSMETRRVSKGARKLTYQREPRFSLAHASGFHYFHD